MTTLQPVLVSYLKLPPDEEPFFRLKDILEIFKDKLEQLTFSLAVSQGPEEAESLAPELKELLGPLIELASDQCDGVSMALNFLRDFAKRFLRLVDALPVDYTGQEVPNVVQEVISFAYMNLNHWGGAEKAMKRLSEEIVTTAEKITGVLEKDKSNITTAVFNDANSKAINDFIHAAQEGATLLRGIAQYFKETSAHFRDETLRAQAPSQEEITMIRKRWSVFLKDLEPLDEEAFTFIYLKIANGPDLEKAKMRGDFWKDAGMESPYASSRTNAPSSTNPQKAVTDSHAQAAEPSSSSPETRRKVSFFRLFFQRILSCFSFK